MLGLSILGNYLVLKDLKAGFLRKNKRGKNGSKINIPIYYKIGTPK